MSLLRHSPRTSGRHAADVITSEGDRTSLVTTTRRADTFPNPPVFPSPVTAQAVREDRQDRAQEFNQVGPDADTMAFQPPWHPDPERWEQEQPQAALPRRHVPPPIPAAPPEPPIQGFRLARLPAAAVAAALPKVTWPAYDGTPESYAAVMQVISVITATRSRWEQPAAWPRHELEPVRS